METFIHDFSGSPSRNSRRPKQSPGLRGGLEIVFNQQ
ncbi:uncharacterized protein LOC131606035 [Vicia villosa]|nr:uncharacterized protein LOC131606035 [Vicia villosa]